MLAFGLLALTGPAMAQGNLVDLQVINRDTGEVLHTWRHDGRLYVAGEPGTRYGLRFSNHSGGRALVVASVDGVNIISGETANYNERGYVLSPWESYEVDGWRKSQTTIAAFQFSPLSASYAAKTGRPGDVGVIGIAVFREQAPPPVAAMDKPAAPDIVRGAPPARFAPAMPMPAPPPAAAMVPTFRSATTNQPGSARADEKLGTAHGASEHSFITLVDFVRATAEPAAISTIEYDTFDHLVAQGVIPGAAPHRPQPFPGEPGLGYVPDPPA
jgi:hypothetical protein